MKKWLMTAAAFTLIMILAACGSEEGTEQKENSNNNEEAFTIGVIPVQTEGAMETAMDKLQSILEKELDRKVDVEVYPDYNGVVEAMNYDKIDMAYFGPLTYVVAHEKSGAEAIITQLIDGEPFYHSYIVTHKDSPYNNMEDLVAAAGEIDFAFGDINSTSGSLIPSIELQDQGVYTSEDDNKFKSVRFTGSHDATALAVQNKQVDAGAIDSAIYNQLVDSGKIDGEQFKTIWESEKLFQYPWAVHQDTDKETIEKLQETFLAIDDKEVLDAFGATGFTEASNEQYESIREAAVKQGIINE
ncbi:MULTISPECIES: phosphate/phosphite/phosphonate ABC transporter substrate-binding protein [Bacillaceae]|uniref:Phosphate/phosphite/phosphonate ABC transporter substrate-binding protein n=1 Tax=Bacillus infantis TaxID=324767 RepID=A0A5D4ST07_9BACI|nr:MULTISPECIES: phosphate/phosphite/phosphonate ABC transporter substrate-binding protein [Bacillus]MDT0159005.1 phosphate/phosphite/phosphonate ABC transporter substrate-binding protein [Bacillus sp. AG4(2022)]MDW2878387.1 phosphate/phosphite/phosphonate ABC transporter substrate-binding protein [Bacillus infantis]TYS65312.1 phosphate/phosphite/phosphonate ABC transporter substrate-binding protein [Bacillus infantis]